jgi:hypothetical protein
MDETPRTVVTWGPDICIEASDGKTPKSADGPAIAWWPSANRLYLAHCGASTEELYFLWYDGKWSDDIKLSGTNGHEYRSRLAPALAVFRNSLVLVWGGPSSLGFDDQNLYYATYDGSAWSPPARIGAKDSHETAEAPALAEYQGLLHLVYRGAGHSDPGDVHLYHCTFDGSEWTDEHKIDQEGYESHRGVALAVFDDRLYAIYSDRDEALHYGSFREGTWSESKRIPAWNYRTSHEPAAAVADGRLWVAFRAVRDISWPDADRILRFGAFNGTSWIDSREVLGGWAESKAGPALCAVPGDRLKLAHRGHDTTDLWTTEGVFVDRNYAGVTVVTAHNAFANDADGFLYTQQSYSVLDQLRRGVRGLMLDIFVKDDALYLCHGFCSPFNERRLSETLPEIQKYMASNPDAVVTLFIESGEGFDVGSSAVCKRFEDELRAAGLFDFLFSRTHWPITPDDQKWPTLDWMSRNGRLVVFTQSTPSSDFPYLFCLYGYSVETVYGDESLDPATWTDRRSESKPIDTASIPLFTMDHFPTADIFEGWGTLNGRDKVMSHVDACRSRYGRVPIFIAVDFFQRGDHGGPRRVAAELNLPIPRSLLTA